MLKEKIIPSAWDKCFSKLTSDFECWTGNAFKEPGSLKAAACPFLLLGSFQVSPDGQPKVEASCVTGHFWKSPSPHPIFSLTASMLSKPLILIWKSNKGPSFPLFSSYPSPFKNSAISPPCQPHSKGPTLPPLPIPPKPDLLRMKIDFYFCSTWLANTDSRNKRSPWTCVCLRGRDSNAPEWLI